MLNTTQSTTVQYYFPQPLIVAQLSHPNQTNMASNKEASHPQEAKNNSTQEEEGLISEKQPSEIITRMLQSQHQHVHGALAPADGQRDHIVKDVVDDESGDVADKCPGVDQQADHFKRVHRKMCST